jgi:predicted site-specific integrase-resolvase
MNKSEYVGANKIKKLYDVSTPTLRRWATNGNINVVRLPSGKRLYKQSDVSKLFCDTQPPPKQRRKLCYARVSSDHQKEDLERQISDLRSRFPNHDIVSDIGSGLNWKRKGFSTLLEHVYNGDVDEVVVTYKDRLCRFGFELVEWLFKKANTKLVVLNGSSECTNSTTELAQDLLSITNVFVARNNGMRSAQNRKNRRNTENQVVSNTTTETKA